jgi:hypothetical protein
MSYYSRETVLLSDKYGEFESLDDTAPQFVDQIFKIA